MEQFVKQYDDLVNQIFNTYVKKPTLIRGILHLLLILYATRLAPSLPKPVLILFENSYFKLFIFSLILWTAQFSPSTSLLIALGFMVSINYANQKPLWEFLENVEVEKKDITAAPMAPSKEVAFQAAAAIVQQQDQQTPIVQGVAQKQDTIVIQPTVVQTPQGAAVFNPSVVVAPAVVATPSGQKVIIQPEVNVVEAPKQPAPAPDPAPALAPALAPAPAPAAPKEQTAQPAATPSAQGQGCYPMRRNDLSNVSAYEGGNSYGSYAA